MTKSVVFPYRVDDLIGRVTFDREMLTHSPSAKGLDKWFPLSPVYHSHADYSDIQGDIKIETTLYEKVIRRR